MCIRDSPSGLKKEELIEVAQKIHDQDSDAQLVLVDDDTEPVSYTHLTLPTSDLV